MKRTLLALFLAATLCATSSITASADAPTDPNCLGQDVKSLSQAFFPWGQTLKSFELTEGGFGTEVLLHLQGQVPLSNCPDNGFPSHMP